MPNDDSTNWRWIPVSDLLPDFGVAVLVYPSLTVATLRYGLWYAVTAPVTHWMPIPPNPDGTLRLELE